MKAEGDKLYKLIYSEEGHLYVCGDCQMAEGVSQTLRTLIQERSGMSNADMDNYLLRMRVSIFASPDVDRVKQRALKIVNFLGGEQIPRRYIRYYIANSRSTHAVSRRSEESYGFRIHPITNAFIF